MSSSANGQVIQIGEFSDDGTLSITGAPLVVSSPHAKARRCGDWWLVLDEGARGDLVAWTGNDRRWSDIRLTSKSGTPLRGMPLDMACLGTRAFVVLDRSIILGDVVDGTQDLYVSSAFPDGFQRTTASLTKIVTFRDLQLSSSRLVAFGYEFATGFDQSGVAIWSDSLPGLTAISVTPDGAGYAALFRSAIDPAKPNEPIRYTLAQYRFPDL